MWYVVLTFKDVIFKSDFMRSFMQFQHHNITSDKLIEQNNEKFYHVKQIPHSGSTNSGNEKQ
jgi:predicted transposase YdaD